MSNSQRLRVVVSVVFVLAAATAAGPSALAVDAEERRDIQQKFMGRWEIDEGYNQGRELTDEEVEGTYTVVTADTITTYDRDQNETYKAKYTINYDTDPIQIDMVATMGGRSMTALGILDFEWLDLDGEDEVTLAYSLKPGERPTEFESPEGSKIIVLELEQADD